MRSARVLSLLLALSCTYALAACASTPTPTTDGGGQAAASGPTEGSARSGELQSQYTAAAGSSKQARLSSTDTIDGVIGAPNFAAVFGGSGKAGRLQHDPVADSYREEIAMWLGRVKTATSPGDESTAYTGLGKARAAWQAYLATIPDDAGDGGRGVQIYAPTYLGWANVSPEKLPPDAIRAAGEGAAKFAEHALGSQ